MLASLDLSSPYILAAAAVLALSIASFFVVVCYCKEPQL